jgi:hypothetical protein
VHGTFTCVGDLLTDIRETSLFEEFLDLRKIIVCLGSGLLLQRLLTLKIFNLFETEKGHLGLAPKGAQIGDIVCFLTGSNTPVIFENTKISTFLLGTVMSLIS